MPPSPTPDRYHRQAILPGVGAEGQQRLRDAHALILGCGALGCTSADLLARAGVGTLTIIDRDVVELTNLQRQSLFTERDAAEALPKAEAARRRLADVNASVRVRPLVADLTPDNAERLLLDPAPGVIVDGADTFETRRLLNDVCVKHAIPYAYGGVVGTVGAQSTFTPHLPGRPCLRCVFPDDPAPGSTPTCETAGVWGPVAAIIAACQAADAMRLLIGPHDAVPASLLWFDLWQGQRRRLDLSRAKDPACPCCVGRRFEALDALTGDAASLCGQNAVQVAPPPGPFDFAALRRRLAAVTPTNDNGFLLRATLPDPPGVELTVFRDGRAIIKGVNTPQRARALYARWVGG